MKTELLAFLGMSTFVFGAPNAVICITKNDSIRRNWDMEYLCFIFFKVINQNLDDHFRKLSAEFSLVQYQADDVFVPLNRRSQLQLSETN
ncbi:MAG: hypothetical protein M5T52_20090 [Ignavibacteriaceae bacterium]|nr:hypothetical protein [Ignavibacteriaceae bacterium]